MNWIASQLSTMVSEYEHGAGMDGHSLLTRLYAAFVVFWLWMMPQMLNARAMASPDDYGSRPAPVNEEEVTKHTTAFHWVIIGHEPFDERDLVQLVPIGTGAFVIAPHGEVPHPPPWY